MKLLINSGADCSLSDGQDLSIMAAMEAAFGKKFVVEVTGHDSLVQFTEKSVIENKESLDGNIYVLDSKDSLNSTISSSPKGQACFKAAKETNEAVDKLSNFERFSNLQISKSDELSVSKSIEETAKVA